MVSLLAALMSNKITHRARLLGTDAAQGERDTSGYSVTHVTCPYINEVRGGPEGDLANKI